MRIVFAAHKYDYGQQSQGHSFEHYNFYDSLVRMGHDILYFDLGSVGTSRTKLAANRLLLESVNVEKPDVLFAVMSKDELDARVIQEISENTATTTIAWFSDDHWRFDNYSRIWAPRFNWAVTTSAGAVSKYHLMGYRCVVKSQWACNTALYVPMRTAKQIPVSFVGLPHSDRRHVIQRLRDSGIEVHVFGKGWGRGRVTQDEMIRIFNESCVNLNLANASVSVSRTARAFTIARNVAARLPLSVLGRRMTSTALETLEQRLGTTQRDVYPEQLKGRNFEVPGCGGLLLTPLVAELKDYYEPDREVGCYRGITDLISEVRAFLADPMLRESIAAAGRQRTLREHTYAHRFAAIFAETGLQSSPPDAILRGEVQPGQTEEIV